MDIKAYLDEAAAKINTASFIGHDPVQFPRRYTRLQDIEIVSFIVATISWGKRSMILRNAERMLAKMGDSPYDYVMNGEYGKLTKANVHRTFFEHDLAYMLCGFNLFYKKNNSMDEFLGKTENPTPQSLVTALREISVEANNSENSKCYPSNLKNSALKRVNMALRWLVRNDGIVDLGVWKSIKPSQLYIPLDVHVGNTARHLGILERKNNDWKSVAELTAILRTYNPEDPILYDFALFGIGVNKETE